MATSTLTSKDPSQLAAVHRVLRDADANDEECLLTDVVLCEVEWVLTSAYGASRKDVLAALQGLASTPRFTFQSRERLRSALDAFQSGHGDLSDHLLGQSALDQGARTTMTFDRALRDTPGFTVGPSATR